MFCRGDYYRISQHKHDVFLEARDTAIALCGQKELGLTWNSHLARDPLVPDPSDLVWVELGPWTKDMAQKYAFARPQSEAQMQAKGYYVEDKDAFFAEEEKKEYQPYDEALTDEQRDKVFATCMERDEAKKYMDVLMLESRGPAYKKLNEAEDKTFEDSRVLEAFDDLRQCYRKSGLVPNEDPDAGYGDGIEGEKDSFIDEEQIELALKVVSCKEKTDFISRVVNVWAEYEAEVIEEYSAELNEIREQFDKTYEDAKNLISAHPERLKK